MKKFIVSDCYIAIIVIVFKSISALVCTPGRRSSELMEMTINISARKLLHVGDHTARIQPDDTRRIVEEESLREINLRAKFNEMQWLLSLRPVRSSEHVAC